MQNRKVDDEMLMAIADGEIEGDEAEELLRVIDADPALAARLESFRSTRRLSRQAYADYLDAPPDRRLVETVSGAAPMGRVRLPRRLGAGLAMAASLLLAAALGYLAGTVGNTPPASLLSAEDALLAALEEQPAGETIGLDGGAQQLALLGTYPTERGPCRLFRVEGGRADAVRAIACRDAAGWHIELAAREGGDDGFATASGGEGLDSWLDAAGAGPALTEEAEAALIAAGWRQAP